MSDRSCILVVDTDILVRHALAEYLRDCGYRVVEAVDADEARAVLQEQTLKVDIVLADAGDPGRLDAFSLARWIRDQGRGIEIILVGTVEKAVKEAAELCEEGPGLSKPYRPEEVVDRIKRLLAESARSKHTPASGD